MVFFIIKHMIRTSVCGRMKSLTGPMRTEEDRNGALHKDHPVSSVVMMKMDFGKTRSEHSSKRIAEGGSTVEPAQLKE